MLRLRWRRLITVLLRLLRLLRGVVALIRGVLGRLAVSRGGSLSDRRRSRGDGRLRILRIRLALTGLMAIRRSRSAGIALRRLLTVSLTRRCDERRRPAKRAPTGRLLLLSQGLRCLASMRLLGLLLRLVLPPVSFRHAVLGD